jgi:apolipoprotein N-acyltransferase
MAMFRGIENCVTVVRPTSGGLSLVTDYRGRQQASFDFYQPGEKLWTATIITGHAFTLYSVIGMLSHTYVLSPQLVHWHYCLYK